MTYPVRSHRRLLTVVTTNCEKSAEVIVGDSRRTEQRNSVIKCMLLGIPDSRKGET